MFFSFYNLRLILGFFIYLLLSFTSTTAQELNGRSYLTLEEQDWVKENPIVTVTNQTNYPPIDFYKDGYPTGLSVDYIKQAAKNVGLTLEFVSDQNWNKLNEQLKHNNIDLIHAITQSDVRDEYLIYTEPYFGEPTVYFCINGASPIKEVEDLYGKRIGVVKDWANSYVYENSYPEFNLVYFTSAKDAMQGLENDQIDIFAIKPSVGNYLINNNNFNRLVEVGNEVLPELKNSKPFRIGVTKKNVILRNIIQKGMNLITNSQYDELLSKWAISSTKIVKDLQLSKQEIDWLENNSIVRVAANPNNYPIDVIGKRGELLGITGELFKIIEEKLNLSFVWVGNEDWDAGIRMIEENKADIISAVSIDNQREININFTSPILNNKYNIFSRSNGKYFTNLNQLAGVKVAQERGSYIVEMLRKNVPTIRIIEVASNSDALSMLSKGDVDAHVGSSLTSLYQLNRSKLNNVYVTGNVDFTSLIGMGVNKNNETLLNILNKAISSIPEIEMQRIIDKWTVVEVHDQINYRLVIFIVFILFVIISIVIFWNRKLKKEIVVRKKIEERLVKQVEINYNYAQQLDNDVERFHATFNNIATGAVVCDCEGNIEVFNKAAEVMFGYNAREVLGKNVKILMPSFYANHHDQYLKNYLETGENKIIGIGRNVTAIRKNGEEFPIHLGIGQMIIKDNISFIGSITDLTSLTQTQFALEKALEEANRASQAKSTFLAETSHELRTPLNAIIGFSEMLLQNYLGDLNDKQTDYIRDIYNSGTHLLDLINTLLDLTEVESGNKDITKEQISVIEISKECQSMIAPRLIEKNLQLELSLPSKETMVFADRLALKQVLINVLTNAVKYSDQDGKISLSVERLGDNVRFCISDDGYGIENELLEVITEPFIKGKKSAYHAERGVGLGLAISTMLVEAHGGKLKIESEVGLGTTVIIIIPNIQEQACIIDPLRTEIAS